MGFNEIGEGYVNSKDFCIGKIIVLKDKLKPTVDLGKRSELLKIYLELRNTKSKTWWYTKFTKNECRNLDGIHGEFEFAMKWSSFALASRFDVSPLEQSLVAEYMDGYLFKKAIEKAREKFPSTDWSNISLKEMDIFLKRIFNTDVQIEIIKPSNNVVDCYKEVVKEKLPKEFKRILGGNVEIKEIIEEQNKSNIEESKNMNIAFGLNGQETKSSDFCVVKILVAKDRIYPSFEFEKMARLFSAYISVAFPSLNDKPRFAEGVTDNCEILDDAFKSRVYGTLEFRVKWEDIPTKGLAILKRSLNVNFMKDNELELAKNIARHIALNIDTSKEIDKEEITFYDNLQLEETWKGITKEDMAKFIKEAFNHETRVILSGTNNERQFGQRTTLIRELSSLINGLTHVIIHPSGNEILSSIPMRPSFEYEYVAQPNSLRSHVDMPYIIGSSPAIPPKNSPDDAMCRIKLLVPNTKEKESFEYGVMERLFLSYVSTKNPTGYVFKNTNNYTEGMYRIPKEGIRSIFYFAVRWEEARYLGLQIIKTSLDIENSVTEADLQKAKEHAQRMASGTVVASSCMQEQENLENLQNGTAWEDVTLNDLKEFVMKTFDSKAKLVVSYCDSYERHGQREILINEINRVTQTSHEIFIEQKVELPEHSSTLASQPMGIGPAPASMSGYGTLMSSSIEAPVYKLAKPLYGVVTPSAPESLTCTVRIMLPASKVFKSRKLFKMMDIYKAYLQLIQRQKPGNMGEWFRLTDDMEKLGTGIYQNPESTYCMLELTVFWSNLETSAVDILKTALDIRRTMTVKNFQLAKDLAQDSAAYESGQPFTEDSFDEFEERLERIKFWKQEVTTNDMIEFVSQIFSTDVIVSMSRCSRTSPYYASREKLIEELYKLIGGTVDIIEINEKLPHATSNAPTVGFPISGSYASAL